VERPHGGRHMTASTRLARLRLYHTTEQRDDERSYSSLPRRLTLTPGSHPGFPSREASQPVSVRVDMQQEISRETPQHQRLFVSGRVSEPSHGGRLLSPSGLTCFHFWLGIWLAVADVQPDLGMHGRAALARVQGRIETTQDLPGFEGIHSTEKAWALGLFSFLS